MAARKTSKADEPEDEPRRTAPEAPNGGIEEPILPGDDDDEDDLEDAPRPAPVTPPRIERPPDPRIQTELPAPMTPGRKRQYRQPKATIRRAPDYAAADQLALVQQTQRRKKAEIEQAEANEYQYFIRCYRGHVGVFLTINPTGLVLTNGDWYSTYRHIEDPWNEEVCCQVCYDVDEVTGEPRGERFPLQVTYLPNGSRRNIQFVVPNAIAFRYPKSEDRMRDEGIKRAAPVDYQTGNADWQPTLEQLSKAEQRRRQQLTLLGIQP